MKLRSTRICKRRASPRLQSNSHQRIPVPRRRSSRLQSSQPPHILGSYYESQSPLEQRPTDPQPSQLGEATSYTCVPTSDPIEVSVPAPQTHSQQTRKRRPDRSIETSAERPPKRPRLTKRNLEIFEMGRQRKSGGNKSTGQSSSTTTTTDKDFGPQLRRNNVVFTTVDAPAPDDINEIKAWLNRPRESEPPDELDYKEYLVATEGLNNELTIQTAAYPLLSKRISREARISGYGLRVNYPWSEVDNHITAGLSDAKPDIFESYRKTDYPPEAVDALSSSLAPTSYDIAMPAFAIEVKGSEGSMETAHLQCAFDGSIMTEGARDVHKYLGKADEEFYGKTQALTSAFNGHAVKYWCHYAQQIQSAAGNDVIKYPQYLCMGDAPRDSFENYRDACKHARNAHDIGYKWATERKDALWAYTNGGNTQTSPDAPISAQQPSNHSLVSISSDTADGYNSDAYDDEADSQLRGEYWRSFAANDQDSSMQIATTDDKYASPDALTYTPITPPQSSKDVTEPRDPDARKSARKTRRKQ